jgi:hypothetical protein
MGANQVNDFRRSRTIADRRMAIASAHRPIWTRLNMIRVPTDQKVNARVMAESPPPNAVGGMPSARQ